MPTVPTSQGSRAMVRLGGRDLLVVSQKHARLRHHLTGEDIRKILSAEYAEHSYRLLCVLIPLMDPDNADAQRQGTAIYPWEFDGFTSEEKWKAYREGDRDAYDENNDPSPTADEISLAFEVCVKVNGVGRAGKLLDLLTAGVKVATTPETQIPSLPDSPGNNGESPSMDSGTSPQTPTESTG